MSEDPPAKRAGDLYRCVGTEIVDYHDFVDPIETLQAAPNIGLFVMRDKTG
jgi:hypothetical protein